jgi:hypothetical protein
MDDRNRLTTKPRSPDDARLELGAHGCDGGLQNGQIVKNDVPQPRGFNRMVGMAQHIAQVVYSAPRNMPVLCEKLLGDAPRGFGHDLQRPFDGQATEPVGLEFGQCPTSLPPRSW